MKKNIIILTTLILFFAACKKEVYEKPKNLIKQKTMINMLVDIHLADAISLNQNYRDATAKRLTSTDFYYSVLHKYNVPDSLFERSYIYYASKPKVFEKMYREVTNHLTEMEYEQKNRQEELAKIEDSELLLPDEILDDYINNVIINNLQMLFREGSMFLINH